MLSLEPSDPLQTLEQKHQAIRDSVRGVASRYHTGLYLWGNGGLSKSYTVEQTLKGLKCPHVLTNSRLTAKGLFDLLHEHPDAIHVLEDIETLFRDKHAAGILRAALGGPQDEVGIQQRTVFWHTNGGRETFIFTGGLIIIANSPIEKHRELLAMKTRIGTYEYKATNEELTALMRQIASKGHQFGEKRLSPEECQEVVDAIVELSTRLQRNLDLRLLIHGFQDRLQWANGDSDTNWRDLLENRFRECVQVPKHGVRAETKNHYQQVITEISHLPANERLAAWMASTGRSKAALYRHMKDTSLNSHKKREMRMRVVAG